MRIPRLNGHIDCNKLNFGVGVENFPADWWLVLQGYEKCAKIQIGEIKYVHMSIQLANPLYQLPYLYIF